MRPPCGVAGGGHGEAHGGIEPDTTKGGLNVFKRICAALAVALVAVGAVALPGSADNNKGDAWLTNSPADGAGHAHEPHLDCTTVYVHGSALDASGTYDIASIPGTGSGKTIWSGKPWTTPGSGDVLATFDPNVLVADAISQDNAVANPNQGYHFKLTLHQDSGDKYKTFWVRCGETPPSPTLGVTKTADASPIVAGNDIGFTVTVAPSAGSFANNVTLSDPLPQGDGLNWFIHPAYSGPGTCAITGTGPAAQTLNCTIGDLGATPLAASASVHLASHTVAGTTAALGATTITNTATAEADGVDPVHSTAHIVLDPAAPDLGIVKTADRATVSAGSQVGFSVTVTNAGPGVAVAVTLHDPIPASGGAWSISPAYAGPGSCAISGSAPSQTLDCTLGNMDAGDSATVHMISTSAPGTATTLTNIATASASNNPAVTATAQVTTTLAPPPPPLLPNLTITKVADASTVTAGAQVGFTITVHNAGPGSATNASLNDPLPTMGANAWSINPAYAGQGSCSVNGAAGSQTLACSFGTMASGASASVHVIGTSPATAVTLTNVATTTADNNPTQTATATVTTTVTPPPASPNLSITKTADAVTATAGSQIGFTIAVTNNGPGAAANASLNDPLPNSGSGTWSISPAYSGPGSCSINGASQPQRLACSFGTLADGASASVHVVAGTASGNAVTLTNVATTLADNNPPVTASAHVTVDVPAAQVLPANVTRSPAPTPAATPAPTPSTAVLGLTITRPGTLPRTGGVPIGLVYPALFMLVSGGVLMVAGRRRLEARAGAGTTWTPPSR